MTEYRTIQPMTPEDEKLWATLVHVGGIFFGIFPALIGYLVLRNRGPFVREHTATALNFQLSMLIYVFAGTLISIPLMFVGVGFLTIWLIPSVASVLVLIFSIIAAVKANQGQFYTYPLAIRFVS